MVHLPGHLQHRRHFAHSLYPVLPEEGKRTAIGRAWRAESALMKENPAPLLALVLLSTGYLGLVAGTASLLPEPVAIHFGLGGEADRWTGRSQAVFFFEALTVVPLIFVVLALVLRWSPAGAFNLPHRDYWLAPERRAQTISLISRQLMWMGCLTVLFLAGIYGLTIIA